MRPVRLDIDLPDVDDDGICELQTTAGAANLVLNGALCDVGTAGEFLFTDSYPFDGGVRIAFESTGNLTGVTFTITGLDENGVAATITRAGPNNGIVETTAYLSKITQIATSGAVGTAVKVGTVDEIATKVFFPNWRADYQFTFAVYGLTGTIQYDIEESFSDPTGLTTSPTRRRI
jgi:hypothetical protein